jgi:hypothetical protein
MLWFPPLTAILHHRDFHLRALSPTSSSHSQHSLFQLRDLLTFSYFQPEIFWHCDIHYCAIFQEEFPILLDSQRKIKPVLPSLYRIRICSDLWLSSFPDPNMDLTFFQNIEFKNSEFELLRTDIFHLWSPVEFSCHYDNFCQLCSVWTNYSC